MRQDCALCMPLVVLVWLSTITHSSIALSQQPTARPMTPTVQMQTVLRQLRKDAIAIEKKRQDMPKEANFAREATVIPPLELIAQNISRTQDRKPFIDAYIRWQLTSFDPPLPEMSKSRQQALLSQLPALNPNPLANPVVLQRINELLQIPILNENEQAQVIQEYTKMSEARLAANERNIPAKGLRMWLIKSYPPASRSGIEARVELVAALVTTGWNAKGAKNLLASSCEMAGQQASLTPAEQQALARLLSKLIGLGTTAIQSLRTGDFTLQVEFHSSMVQDYEVRQWTRMLHGQNENPRNNPAMQP